ncbi:hypothetical protein N9Y80_04610 [Porticoccaceae bacterium]|nr:hypothetical protein [Porticoccaceae bacterium]
MDIKQNNENKKKSTRGASLLRRFYKETGTKTTWEENPVELIEWIKSLQSDEQISTSTFKNYKRWLAFFCEENGDLITGQKIREIGKKHRPSRSQKKEGVVDLFGNELQIKKKLKQSDQGIYASDITEQKFIKFGKILIGKNVVTSKQTYSSGPIALGALRCSMMIGLRPIEWKNVMLKDTVFCRYDAQYYNHVIEVKNAKLKSHQREKSLEENTRRLIISNFSDADYHFVRAFISSIPKKDKEFSVWYEKIRKAIFRAGKNMLKYDPQPNQPQLTLYSGRHIFASEARRQGTDKFHLAALLGHSNTYNQSYYGDISGELSPRFDFTIPKSWPGECDKIRKAEIKPYGVNQPLKTK